MKDKPGRLLGIFEPMSRDLNQAPLLLLSHTRCSATKGQQGQKDPWTHCGEQTLEGFSFNWLTKERGSSMCCKTEVRKEGSPLKQFAVFLLSEHWGPGQRWQPPYHNPLPVQSGGDLCQTRSLDLKWMEKRCQEYKVNLAFPWGGVRTRDPIWDIQVFWCLWKTDLQHPFLNVV